MLGGIGSRRRAVVEGSRASMSQDLSGSQAKDSRLVGRSVDYGRNSQTQKDQSSPVAVLDRPDQSRSPGGRLGTKRLSFAKSMVSSVPTRSSLVRSGDRVARKT